MVLVLAFAGPKISAAAQVNLADWPKVHLEILGADAEGLPLQGLTADNLSVMESGHSVASLELKPLTEPISVCVLLDASSSMHKSLPVVRAAVARLLEELPADDEVCVADFSFRVHIGQALTTDRQAAARTLQSIKSGGGTGLYDALFQMADYMERNARNASRAVIVFSDGDDNYSKTKPAALQQEWRRPGAPVLHLVALPKHSFISGGRDDEQVLQLSRMGGGLVTFPRMTPDMLAAVDRLNAAMKSRYLLTYSSDNQSKDGRLRPVDVTLDEPHQKAKATVHAPQGYYAPSQ